ncbi:hypothetical protein M3P05_20445 [Sansalvadorimonas sp. 2012CJ34-2]|uniref:Uncharacterized protein n=1 Tax=Parendozoicomonas callyspongiae TaxID=2942213 RepID=A0ABT0PLN3_9GAMM|nr:hypothetical protein [Sansalvadorimonas sp. 2012CJ34-2]MCL6272289.1 hypothetical protein [Sansalvadorimonas sp. 2012CJ34-2]
MAARMSDTGSGTVIPAFQLSNAGTMSEDGKGSFAGRQVDEISPELKFFKILAPELHRTLKNGNVTKFVSHCASESLIQEAVSDDVNDLTKKTRTPSKSDLAKRLVSLLSRKIKNSNDPKDLCLKIAGAFKEAGQTGMICDYITKLAEKDSVVKGFKESINSISDFIENCLYSVADSLLLAQIITEEEKEITSNSACGLNLQNAVTLMEALEESITIAPANLETLKECLEETGGIYRQIAKKYWGDDD